MKGSSLAYSVWACAALVWCGVQVAYAAGIRINHTASMPIGIWRVQPLAGPLKRGEVVSFCPPGAAVVQVARERGYLRRGSCPGGHEPLLKRVYALPGDRVRLDADGVSVNGIRLFGTRPLPVDSRGREIESAGYGTRLLGDGEFWAGSRATPESFDSRYFGAVALNGVLGVATLLWGVR